MPRIAEQVDTVLARTRLDVPRPPAHHLPRPRLSRMMQDRRQITLLVAPAGFGKTTTLAGWLAEAAPHRRVIWLALEEDDLDPLALAGHLVAALQAADPRRAQAAAQVLAQPAAVAPRAVLVRLLNDLAETPDGWTLVLDDLHRAASPATLRLLAYGLEHLPQNIEVILTSRAEPDLPLARLRAEGRLTEIDAAELRFTSAEAEQFLTRTMPAALAPDQMRQLDTRLDGWIAGLQMAALWLQRGHAPADLAGLADLDGRNQFFSGYLAREVLDSQPDDIRDFLIDSAVLDRLSAPLCDAIRDRQDSALLLDRVRRAGLFLTGLDARGAWFRYHDLFREFLLGRLPDDHRHALCLRAADWFAAQGDPSPAIRYAIAGGDRAKAAGLLRQHVDGALSAGAFAQLLAWLDQLGDPALGANPDLAGYKAWLLYMRGRVAEAERYIDLDAPADAATPGALLAFRAFLALNRGKADMAQILARAASARLADSTSYYRGLSLLLLGAAQRISGARREAMATLRETAKLGARLDAPTIRLEAISELAILHHGGGDLRHAKRLVMAGLRDDAQQGNRAGALSGLLNIRLGQFLYDENALALGEAQTRTGLQLAEELGHLGFVGLGLRHLALLIHAQDRRDEAAEQLAIAREIADRMDNPRLHRQLDLLGADLALRDADPARARRLFQTARPLAPDSRDDALTEARLFLAEGRPQAAEALLAPLDRADRAAGRLGALIAPLTLRGIAAEARGEIARAARLGAEALALAVPQGFLRPVLDQGPAALALVERLAATDPRAADFLRRILRSPAKPAPPDDSPAQPLTDAETAILRLLALGRRNAEIASELSISVGTVKWHVHNILGKLDVSNRAAAVHRARDLDWL